MNRSRLFASIAVMSLATLAQLTQAAPAAPAEDMAAQNKLFDQRLNDILALQRR